MIVVMQCAKTKQPDAGLMRTQAGQPVKFVARPDIAPPGHEHPNLCPPGVAEPQPLLYARPDDVADTGKTWRQELVAYNQAHTAGSSGATGSNSPSSNNPLGLLPAGLLYKNKTYRLLLDTFGTDSFYIFSAGWGLVRSDYMIPDYRITLSPGASGPDLFQRRLRTDPYADFNMLPADTAEPVLYLGSKVYVPLFCQLTQAIPAQRIVYYNAKEPPVAPNCELRKYDIPKRPTGTTTAPKPWPPTPQPFCKAP